MRIRPRRLGLTALALLAAALFSGCGDAPSEDVDFDRTPTLLLREHLDAANAGDFALAARKAQRLHDLAPENLDYQAVYRHYREDAALEIVQQELDQQDLPGAFEAVREAVLAQDTPGRLRPVEEQLGAVLAIREFIDAKQASQQPDAPPQNAIDARAKLLALPKPGAVGFTSEAYAGWYASQLAYVEELSRQERAARLAAMLNQLEIAVLRGDERAVDIARAIATLNPEHPVHAHWPDRLADKMTVSDVLALPEGLPRELAIVIFWQRNPRVGRSLMHNQDDFSESPAGRWLQAVRLAESGDGVAAAGVMRELERDYPGIDPSPVILPLAKALEESGGGLYPTVPGALRLIYHFQSKPADD